ncbi:cyclophilin-like fold protein [Paenirhodobacter sp.]|uniref:cyclophilin-like fold protein n=1 Tax=Paenirhodobacter sp. TaxID=1965326 RepID=UPI003B3EFD59
MMLAATASIAGIGLAGCLYAQGQRSDNAHLRVPSGEQVVMRIGDKAFTVDLYDNPTAADLLPRLPLTVQASNYPGYDEKVIRLPMALSMEGAPRGDDPLIPEVGYYHPGKWIALYYGPIGYWSGKVPLGTINASVDELRAIPDNAPVAIERAAD